MKVSRIKIKVFGSVQGVFFRYTTRKVAQRLGLDGYVKNLPDGTVYIEAEGSEDKLYELLEFSKKGQGPVFVHSSDYRRDGKEENKGINYELYDPIEKSIEKFKEGCLTNNWKELVKIFTSYVRMKK